MPTATSPSFPILLAISVALAGTLLTIALSVLYLRFVRMDRPAIGTFNGVDIVVVFGFIVVLPLLYLILPLTPLLVVLGIVSVVALLRAPRIGRTGGTIPHE